MPISSEEYKQIGATAAAGVAVVAAYETDTAVALTVSSFVSLSFDPPLVMFAIQHRADSYPAMVGSKAFGVSLLTTDQSDVARRFARKGREKTLGTRFDSGVTLHVPLIPDALAQIECLTNQIILSGDHAIVVGMVETARIRPAQPLLYLARQYGQFVPLGAVSG